MTFSPKAFRVFQFEIYGIMSLKSQKDKLTNRGEVSS